MRDCLNYFLDWARRIGLSNVRVDGAGNFRAILAGETDKRLVIGSHLDSVPNAGAFDGVLGVVMGMLLAESCAGSRPRCTIEIVGFSEEEGVRFQRPFIGSIGFVQGLSEELLGLEDAGGISVQQAIRDFGLAGGATAQMERADGYLEFHIEQGPVLENLGLPVAVVDAVVGQTRASVAFEGQANHAGTTPMSLRQDALCAAAEWALSVESIARHTDELVATVGSVKVSPDAVNIVPGKATLSLDVRHAVDEVRNSAFEAMVRRAEGIAARRGVNCTATVRMDQKAVPMDAELVRLAMKAVADTGVRVHRMTSGAGHDAMIVAERVPAAMIFLRSPGGVSHHPDETVLAADVDVALAAGRVFVQNFC